MSDGTPAGTRLLKNLDPEPNSSGLSPGALFVPLVNRVFFQRRVGNDQILYVSNGTGAGTASFFTFTTTETNPPFPMSAAGGKLFFLAPFCTGEVCEVRLYVSDGSEAGTRVVIAFPESAGSLLRRLIPVGNRVLLIFATGNAEDKELWVSDGTTAGTSRIHTTAFAPGLDEQIAGPITYLATSQGLLRTDGTSAGTRMFLSPGQFHMDAVGDRVLVWHCPQGTDDCALYGMEPDDQEPTLLQAAPHFLKREVGFARAGSALIYGACDNGPTGCEPWRTDGTPAGTFLLGDFRPGSAGSFNTLYETGILFSSLGSHALLLLNDGDGPQVWSTDGSVAGTIRLTDVSLNRNGDSKPTGQVVAGGLLYFSAGVDLVGELWASDGTRAGTRRIDQTSYYPTPAVAFGDQLVYAVRYRNAEQQLQTDLRLTSGGPGTTIFTVRGAISQISASGGKIFFTNDENPDDFTPQTRLLVSDGTRAGTRLVRDLGAISQLMLFGANGHAFILLEDSRLVGSDGTEAGTVTLLQAVKNFNETWDGRITVFGDRLLIFSGEKENTKLYSSDGTPDGTRVLADTPSIFRAKGLSFVADAGSRIFFHLDYDLWISDGTSDGTRRLGNLGLITEAVGDTGTTFILSPSGDGVWLWFSDGTPEGTRKLFQLPSSPELQLLTVKDGVLLFSKNRQLWRSDSTEAGTYKLQDLRVVDAAWLGDQLLLSADDGQLGVEPWVIGPGAYVWGGLNRGVPSGGRLDLNFTLGETWPANDATPGPMTLTLEHDPRLTYESNTAGVEATVTPGQVVLNLPANETPLSQREIVIAMRAPEGAIGTTFSLELRLEAAGDPNAGDNTLTGSARIARLFYLPILAN